MKLWIRLDAGAPRDPKITELARALGVRRAEAFGLAASVWCVMAEHAVDGSLATIADEDLEAWAYWVGKRGKFAAAFRATFVSDDGTVGGWNERQGKLLDRMERDRQRHKKPDGGSAEAPRKEDGNSAEIPRNVLGVSTSTVRNGTVRTTKALTDATAPVPQSWVAEGFDIWTAKVGATTHPRLGKALSAPVTQHTWPVVRQALVEYVEYPANGKPKKLEWFAQDVVRWIAEANEPVERDGVLTEKGRRFMGIS
jgi:hypothetical protein